MSEQSCVTSVQHEPSLQPCSPQLWPQEPQWLMSIFKYTSQPLSTLSSQLANPAAHVILQVEPTQLGCPFTELHALLHAPQFQGSVLVLVSQPLLGSPSQSP